MAQRREIESRLALYDDLAGILGAMRSFALAELRWVGRREEAQQQVLDALHDALHAMAHALPAPLPPAADIWLLFGSTRGFCGSFNEDVLHAWQQGQPRPAATIAIGERLAGMLPAASAIAVRGAEGGLDAAPAVDRMLLALGEARAGLGVPAGLVACWRDEEGIRVKRLLPLPDLPLPPVHLPYTHEPPPQVAAQVAEHCLYHGLLALLLRSIRSENRLRLLQMENALRHLERGSEELGRLRNRLRQEEIVEEIELMARGRDPARIR